LRTELLNSSAAADGNTSSAGATSNSATNGLALDANSLAATSALQNFQVTNADVSAFIGLAGTPGSDGSSAMPYPTMGLTGTSSQATLDADTGLLTIGSGGSVTLTWNPAALGASALADYLDSLGFVVVGSTATGQAGQSYDLSGFNGASLGVGGALSATGFTVPAVPATPGTPNQGGVVLAVQSSTAPGYTAQVIGSTLSVNDNTTSGSVTGNSASNTLAVTANEIAHGTAQTTSTASSVGGSVL